MALARVVAAVDATVVVVAILAIHVVTVEFDTAAAGADIQAVVLPPVVLLVVPIQADLAPIGGDLDVVVVLGRRRSKGDAVDNEQREQQTKE